MATKRLDAKDLLNDLKTIGRNLEDVGRALVSTTGRTVRSAAEETLDRAAAGCTAAVHMNAAAIQRSRTQLPRSQRSSYRLRLLDPSRLGSGGPQPD